MKLECKEVNKSTVVWSDNFFTQNELEEMYLEARYLNNLELLSPTDTGGATITVKDNTTGEEKKEQLKKNKAIFLEKLYATEPKLSSTLQICNKRLQDDKFIDYMADIHPYFITLKNMKWSILLSYYDNADRYKGHRDSAFVTVLTWFYEEPKAFTGGDFIIENDFKIECKRGRTVFMPSYLLHEVTPIIMPEDKQEKGLGRYTLSHFIW